jgi:hypothetical protein
MIEVVGISGKAGSGKDFVGREVFRPAGYSQWALAWPMKAQLIGQTEFTYHDVFHDKPPIVRHALQVIGTERGWHVYGREYWLKQADAWLRTMEENLGITKFYFTDIRFPHEVEWLRKRGGKLVRLLHANRRYPLAGTDAANHSSETALDDWTDWDCVLENYWDRSVASFRDALRRAGVLNG